MPGSAVAARIAARAGSIPAVTVLKLTAEDLAACVAALVDVEAVAHTSTATLAIADARAAVDFDELPVRVRYLRRDREALRTVTQPAIVAPGATCTPSPRVVS